MAELRDRALRTVRRLEIRAGLIKRDLRWLFGGKAYYLHHAEAVLGRQRWIFLVGCNNSGTTLLHDLMVASGRFASMPHEGQRYTRAIRIAERQHHERVWSEYLEDLRMTEDDSADVVPRLLHDWMCAVDHPQRTLLLEKTTANSVRTRWLQKVFPNCCFIGMVRNGYAVSEGICRKGRKDADRAARHWRLVNRILEEDSQHLRNYLMLRYEDLASDPRRTLARVAAFIGLPEGALSDHLDASRVVDMNPDSLARLTPAQIDCISDTAADLLRLYDYGLP